MYKWFLLVIICANGFISNAQINYKIGDTIPVFSATTHDGGFYTLDTVLPRKTILVLWASWNSYSMQLMNEIKQQYAFVNPTRRGIFYHNVEVIDISIDQRKDLYDLTLYREKWQWETHLYEKFGWESDVINLLKLKQVPTFFLLDENRVVLSINPDVTQIRSLLSKYRVVQNLPN